MSATDQLFRTLQTRIVTGEMPVGSRFPSQASIAVQQAVGRSVVREAVARLVALGLATSRQGSGVFVCDPIALSAKPDTPAVPLTRSEAADLFELRLALEGEVAALAAQRRSSGDVDSLEALLFRMQQSVSHPQVYSALDAAFHRLIAVASRNSNFSDLTLRFADQLIVGPKPAGRHQLLREAQAATRAAHAEHASILDAIAAGNPQDARNAAIDHVRHAMQRF